MTDDQIRSAARDEARKVLKERGLPMLDPDVEGDLERGVANRMKIHEIGEYAKRLAEAGASGDVVTAIFLFVLAFSEHFQGLTADEYRRTRIRSGNLPLSGARRKPGRR